MVGASASMVVGASVPLLLLTLGGDEHWPGDHGGRTTSPPVIDGRLRPIEPREHARRARAVPIAVTAPVSLPVRRASTTVSASATRPLRVTRRRRSSPPRRPPPRTVRLPRPGPSLPAPATPAPAPVVAAPAPAPPPAPAPAPAPAPPPPALVAAGSSPKPKKDKPKKVPPGQLKKHLPPPAEIAPPVLPVPKKLPPGQAKKHKHP